MVVLVISIMYQNLKQPGVADGRWKL